MKRILEREIMDDRQQAIAYAKADFSASNQWYVENLVADYPDCLRNVVDIGCGPADIPVRLAQVNSNIRITAIDGSAEMIRLATESVQRAGLEKQIRLIQGYIPGVDVRDHSYDAVLSKDFLHHLPDPIVLWNEARRFAKPGAVIYVMDLFRPETPEAARKIVEKVARHEDLILKQDFYNSLCASFTVEEAKEQLKKSGLHLYVSQISERHMLIKGSLR